jgi:hypothetical protein
MRAISARRRIAAAAAAACCALGAAGCGSSSSSSSNAGASGGTVHGVDAAFISKSAATSSAQAGFKMTMTAHITVAGQALSMNGTGAFDEKDRAGQMTLSMPLTGLPSAEASALGGGTLSLEEVLDGTTIYIKLPASLASKLPGGKPWMSLDMSKLSSAAGVPGLSALFSNPSSADPSEYLQFLRSASGNVQSQGSQTINGVQTTLYTATIDVSKESALVPQAQRAAVNQALGSLSKMTGLKSIPMDVWIDHSGLVRQVGMTINQTNQAVGQLGMQLLIDFTSYGPQAKPSAPPASDVMDMSQLLGAAGGAAGAAGVGG